MYKILNNFLENSNFFKILNLFCTVYVGTLNKRIIKEIAPFIFWTIFKTYLACLHFTNKKNKKLI